MIKTGIYGPADPVSPLRKQLLRLLLRHPDVDLRTVAAPGASGALLSELHPVYTGETELRLEAKPNLSKLDVLFVIDEVNLTAEIKDMAESNPEFRLIVLGEAPTLRQNPLPGMVYGFAESNRKALVRGARTAVSPSPAALLIETALFPMAKNWMLPKADITGTLSGSEAIAGSIDEAAHTLRTLQGDFPGIINLERTAEAPYERMDLTLRVPTRHSLAEVTNAFETAYEDHSFAYVVPDCTPLAYEDLRGSNKCLITIGREAGFGGEAAPGEITITATADYLTRGNAGNAVHLMNLLFGLHERTGLSI